MATSRKPTRPAPIKTTAKPKLREKPASKIPAATRPAVAVSRPGPAAVKAPQPVAPVVKEAPPAIVKPAVPPFEKEWLDGIRHALLQRRTQINSVVQANQSQLAANEGDPSDIADRASDGFEDELTAGLLSIEAAQLEEVDEAIGRMDAGTYGLCLRCGKPIPRKRLEILPFAKRCLKCEGEKERSHSLADLEEGGAEEEEEESDTE